MHNPITEQVYATLNAQSWLDDIFRFICSPSSPLKIARFIEVGP